MPEVILQFKIFISCPGDVEEERKRLEVFLENAETALAKKGIPASLKPLYWKNIVAPYDGTRGQTVINNEFNDYDYYIGILAERFGTPTTSEDGVAYGSGTEEEFRNACLKRDEGAEIGAYIFFKKVIAPTDSEKLTEYNRVLAFKRELQSGGWVNNFEDAINLSDKLNSELIPLIEKKVMDYKNGLVRDFIAKAEATEVAGTDGPVLALATLTDDLTEVEGPIPRTVSIDDADDIANLLFSEDYKKKLPELVITEKRLVVLGNAGSGKSTELGKLAEFYKGPESVMVPVFTRLNTYKGGAIVDFLPGEFKNVPESVALVILDGLDEIEQEHFNEAIEKINEFAEQFPQITLVLSCRTNFFELAVGGGKDTLPGFALSHINEISPADIIQALNDQGDDGEAFYREAYDNGYQELLTKPFFLNILSSVYRQTKSLQGGRDRIFSEAIRLKLAKAATRPDRLAIDPELVTRLLTRLGLIMEYLGRNYLTQEEMEQVIALPADRQAIENSLIALRVKGNWGFEHNNIQEYFAATALTGFAIGQIKHLVAFYPEYDKIKPSWLNTLSFLINISSGESRQELLDWIIAIEPESVIRFEPDRVDPAVRFRVFSAIFQEFQDLGLWIRSNRFTEAELGRFGDTPDALELLKRVIANPGKSPTNKISAMRLLEHFKLQSEEDNTSVKELILQFISQQEENPEAIYSAIHVLTGLGLADAATVRDFVGRYRERKEPYYRASLYTLVNQSGNTENYVDVFTDGIVIVGNRDQAGQRTSLWDETIQLKNALLKIKQPGAIDRVLEFFSDPSDSRYRHYSDKKDVMESAVKQAAILYPDHPSFFNRLLELYVNFSKISDINFLKNFRDFFEQTGTVRQAFESIYEMQIATQFQKELLLSLLLNEETAEFLVDKFLAGDISEPNLRSLAQCAFYRTRQTDYEAGAEKLEALMLAKAGIAPDPPQHEARQEKQRKHEQDSFDLLFDEAGMKAGLEKFWVEIGKYEINWNEIWDFANRYDQEIDTFFPRSVTNVVAELCRIYHTVSADDVKNLLTETPRFEDDRMESIYGVLKDLRPVVLSKSQEEIITDWANRKAGSLDISKGISPDGRFDTHVLMIWFFVKRLGIRLPAEKLLDFTLFYDYNHGSLEDWYGPIAAQTGSEPLNARIIANLKAGIDREQLWSNNAEYALVNGLTDTYNSIKSDLARITEITSVKESIAKKYLEVTDDQEGLFSVLTQLRAELFRWELVDLLKNGRVKTVIESHLLAILRSAAEEPGEKLEAAKRLTEMSSKEGFEYYADHILQNRQLQSRHDYWFRYLSNLTTLDYLPRLIDLLEQSLLPQNTADVFTRIDGQVLDALFNLSIQSAENLSAVRAALENKIAQHAPEWNYLMPFLKRMDFQYHLNRSSQVNLETALAAVNALGL